VYWCAKWEPVEENYSWSLTPYTFASVQSIVAY
jgi:hypothetical protein